MKKGETFIVLELELGSLASQLMFADATILFFLAIKSIERNLNSLSQNILLVGGTKIQGEVSYGVMQPRALLPREHSYLARSSISALEKKVRDYLDD